MDSSAGTIHSTTSVRGGSWQTLECVQFDITAARSRAGWKQKQQWCYGCGRTQSAKGECERKKKRTEGKVPNQRSTRGFKGVRPDSSPSASGPPCQLDFRPRARVPAKQPPTRATPQFPRYADLQRLRAVMMEWSHLSCRPRCPRP
jgi:hypothetical protein